jgi:hypothetical protein
VLLRCVLLQKYPETTEIIVKIHHNFVGYGKALKTMTNSWKEVGVKRRMMPKKPQTVGQFSFW